MTCCYDGEMPAVFESAEIVARKRHTCCECGNNIESGERYERASGLWDGRWSHYKTCEKCADLRSAVEAMTCVYFGQLAEAYDYVTGQQIPHKNQNRGE